MKRDGTIAMLVLCLVQSACGDNDDSGGGDEGRAVDAAPPQDAGLVGSSDPIKEAANRLIDEGRETFRHDTFGDEAFWGGALRLHEAIVGAESGGVGAGISPTAALGLGLKVDAAALSQEVMAELQAGA